MHWVNFLKTYTDYTVIAVLGGMAFVVVWLSLERMVFFRHLKIEEYSDIYALEKDLTNNMTLIASVAANAPYIGLLGTVVGILITFFDMGQAGGDVEASKIMIGLALALKATALGILVAIPSTVFYNGLLRRVEVKKLQWQSLNAKSDLLVS